MKTFVKQKGVVLVIGLLMLLVITIVGVTAMSSTTSNERMAANNQFHTISFQAAESAIHNVARPSALTPAFDSFPTPLATQSFNYTVNLHSGTGATVAVQADADIAACGEIVELGTDPKLKIVSRIYDVIGSGGVGNAAGERHLMRMAHTKLNSYDKPFDNTVCEVIEE